MIYGYVLPHSHDDVGWLLTVDVCMISLSRNQLKLFKTANFHIKLQSKFNLIEISNTMSFSSSRSIRPLWPLSPQIHNANSYLSRWPTSPGSSAVFLKHAEVLTKRRWWYETATELQKQQVRSLLANGQLEVRCILLYLAFLQMSSLLSMICFSYKTAVHPRWLDNGGRGVYYIQVLLPLHAH